MYPERTAANNRLREARTAPSLLSSLGVARWGDRPPPPLERMTERNGAGGEPPRDGTLGGYLAVHDRPPAFEGPDGHPYTVSIEVERTGNLLAPYQGYLVFPRWAQTGVGIVGHAESPTLVECRTQMEAQEGLGALTLMEVQEILEAAVRAGLETDQTT